MTATFPPRTITVLYCVVAGLFQSKCKELGELSVRFLFTELMCRVCHKFADFVTRGARLNICYHVSESVCKRGGPKLLCIIFIQRKLNTFFTSYNKPVTCENKNLNAVLCLWFFFKKYEMRSSSRLVVASCILMGFGKMCE